MKLRVVEHVMKQLECNLSDKAFRATTVSQPPSRHGFSTQGLL